MISLCMICGNEEAIILKCLESAKDAFDELCLVRAIGSQEYDGTMEAACEWIKANDKKFRIGHYDNKIDLPHVDDFGAARNHSFSLATGDWILWLDCDDYLDEINCRRIREAVKTEDFDALMCSYLVEHQGAILQRERLIRRGHGRWKNAIHETCEITGRIGNCPQIEVFHSPHEKKHVSSALRNATILERVVKDMPRHYFYLHAELKMLGRKEEAIAAAHAALALSDGSKPEEVYTICLNLSELEPDKTEYWLLEAARVQPHRREAFAYLCQKCLIDGRISDATSYFRIMDCLPVPVPSPWTHQGIWYGWARNLLMVRVLWARGQKEAQPLHDQFLKDPEYAAGFKKFSSPKLTSPPIAEPK